jgi:hypothetical protein
MSLKPSIQPKRKYPGNLGEHDLKQALELLFLIKGKSFKKKSPDFIVPTADEFFTFCKFVSEEIFLKKTNAKKLFRSLSSEKLNHLNNLDFFEYIVKIDSEDTYDRLNICLNVVYYALYLYFFTGAYMKASVTDTDISDSYKQFFICPLNWFCTHVMPSLEKNRKEVVIQCMNLLKNKEFAEFESEPEFFKTAQKFSEIYDGIKMKPIAV